MGIAEVTQMFEEFDQIADKAKLNLNEMLSIISDGKVPTEETIKGFNKVLANLQDKYDNICNKAKNILETKEFPSYGSSIVDFKDAVNNCKIKMVELKIQKLRRVLLQFISVKSFVVAYEEALLPFQSQAKELLENIENQIGDSNVDLMIKESVAPELFIKALKIEDLDSDEGIDIIEQVSEYYPVRVQSGLTRGKYYLNGTEENLQINSSTIKIEENVKSYEDVSFIKDKAILRALEGTTNNDDMDITHQELEQETMVDKRNDDIPVVTDLGKLIIQGDEEDMLDVINRLKYSSPSASTFRKDISNMPEEVKAIFPLFTNLGILTIDFLHKFGVCMDCFYDNDEDRTKVATAVEILVHKGFLAQYSLFENEYAYCLSEYSHECIKKESVASLRKFWATPWGNLKVIGKNRIYKKDFIQLLWDNELLLSYLYGVKVTLDEEHYNVVRTSIRRSEKKYFIKVIYEGTVFNCEIVDNIKNGTFECNASSVLIIPELLGNIELLPDNCDTVLVYLDELVYKLNKSRTYKEQIEEFRNRKKLEESTGQDLVGKEIAAVNEIEEHIAQPEKGNEKTADIDGELDDVSPMVRADVYSDSQFLDMINTLLYEKNETDNGLKKSIVHALLLAKTSAQLSSNEGCKKLYNQLLYATDLPLDDRNYTSKDLAEVFPDMKNAHKCLLLASYLYALLVPGVAYDYGLKNQSQQFLYSYDDYFAGLEFVKPLLNKLISVHDAIPSGFTSAIIALLGNADENDKFVKNIQAQANELLILPHIKTRMKTLPVMYRASFGVGSDLYQCMEIIKEGKNSPDNIDFASIVLSEYSDEREGVYVLDATKIENRLNEFWYAANPGNKYELEFDAKPQALRQFYSRLSVIKLWLEHESSISGTKYDLGRLKNLKKEILQYANQALEDCKNHQDIPYINVLEWMLLHIKQYLTGKVSVLADFSELLYSGIISQDDNGIPVLNESFNSVKYYEPWRNVLRHIEYPHSDFAYATSEILDNDESEMFDNLHQLQLIGNFMPADEQENYIITKQQIVDAKKNADNLTTKFQEKLELAYTYNRISETQKENFVAVVKQYKPLFFDLEDFGCWRQFLSALGKQMDEITEEKSVKLRKELDVRMADAKGKGKDLELLKEADKFLKKDRNFAVTEEYINRYDSGEGELTDELQAVLHDEDVFSKFLSDDVFLPIYEECMRWNGRATKSLKNFGWNYLEKKLPKEWTSRLREDSKKFITKWPAGKGTATLVQIEALFRGMGFDVKGAKRNRNHKEEIFQLHLSPVARSMADYRHPISAFGTRIKSPVNVIILFGNYTAKQLVDTVSSVDFGGMAIVLIDRPLERRVRGQICEIFHTQTSGQNPFLLIDQVLMIYLTMHQITERIPIMLKCTLPYTTYQPFVRDGGSTADEMFCGRTKELADIINPNGACVVYGGRQLGKTALLERAESRCHKPQNKAYAVYVNIINIKSEEEFVKTLVGEINKKTNLDIVILNTIPEFCSKVENLFRDKKIESMLLLLDESDNFLASIANKKYTPLQPLIDLKRRTENSFKFVLAGLHNVCRAKNATEENGVFGQLGFPLCVKPLSPNDALQLISRPLRYLGFQIDRYPHLETILTNTNYYPGILQFFGYMLVDTLTGHYGKYYSAVDGNPPFTLQDDQLGAVMNSADLNRSIRDKFRWSLELDKRYFMLARCIAVLYFFQDEESDNWLGFLVKDIIEVAKEYDINCLIKLSERDYINLLDEMVEMGILSRPKKGAYRLRRSSFVDFIGSDFDQVDEEIISNNKEGVH